MPNELDELMDAAVERQETVFSIESERSDNRALVTWHFGSYAMTAYFSVTNERPTAEFSAFVDGVRSNLTISEAFDVAFISTRDESDSEFD